MKYNRQRNTKKVIKLPRWCMMVLNSFYDQFGVTKSEVLRSMFDSLDRREELIDPRAFAQGSIYLQQPVLFDIHLGDRNIQLLEEISKNLKFSFGETVASIVLTGMDDEAKRLEQNKPRVPHLESLIHHQVYLSEELVDSLYSLRDQLGESLSLLLKEAVLSYRQRTLPPLPLYRKERNLNLRLASQEWERLKVIAASSDMNLDEAIASLLVEHYFKKETYAKTAN